MTSLALVLIALLGLAGVGQTDLPPTPQPAASPLLVGSYYFPGHFNAARWVPMAQNGWPVPVLGWYRDGEPEVADWHIKWAVEHGIDFFAFDWYYDYRSGQVSIHNSALDQGFLRARYRDQMRFGIFWCNEEAGPVDYTEEQMLRMARVWRERYLGQPNYLKIKDGAVVWVSEPRRLIERFGVEGCAALIRRMEAEAGTRLFLVALAQHDQKSLKAAGYSACSAYNYASINLPPGARQAPYDTMVSGYETMWRQARDEGVLPFIPPVSPGWDSRPWYGDKAMVRTGARPEKFRAMCEAAKRYVDPEVNAVIAECWNEFGEGSYLEPTEQHGFGYLDALRDAFCPDSPNHVDPTPHSLGVSVPVYDDIPVFTAADLAAQDGNLLYNPGFERRWGWVNYGGGDVVFDETGPHGGRRSVKLDAPEPNLKSATPVPVKVGATVEVWAWIRCAPGASAELKCALFGDDGRWLGRYLEIGATAGTEWTRVARALTWAEAEAAKIDLEVVARGGAAWVDDVGIRVKP